jgi:NAD(P)-dependent dehydrogenase (short-subunit alcohol dehydrogenase family)
MTGAPMPKRLDGRVAIVTGGGGTIGTATAVRFAREGADVVIAQRSPAPAERVVDRIEELGGAARFVRTDLAADDAISALVDATVESFGGVDIVVNNAARHGFAPAATMDAGDWSRTLDVNLTAPFRLAQRAHEHMDGYGRIVNVGAIQSRSPLDGAAAYASTKAGLEGLSRSLAVEWSDTPDDVTVNTVLAGPIYQEADPTDHPDLPVEEAIERVPPAVDEAAATLVGRWGRASDAANLIAFLASPEASFITGAVVPCDGADSSAGSPNRSIRSPPPVRTTPTPPATSILAARTVRSVTRTPDDSGRPAGGRSPQASRSRRACRGGASRCPMPGEPPRGWVGHTISLPRAVLEPPVRPSNGLSEPSRLPTLMIRNHFVPRMPCDRPNVLWLFSDEHSHRYLGRVAGDRRVETLEPGEPVAWRWVWVHGGMASRDRIERAYEEFLDAV